MANKDDSDTDDYSKPAAKRGDAREKSSNEPAKSTPALREELEKAAEGLSHTSESDSPFRYFTLPVMTEIAPSAEGFLNCLGLSIMCLEDLNLQANQLIEETPFDGFFPDLEALAMYAGTDASDPEVVAENERFRNLEEVIKRRLRDVKVFRVGKVEVHCYVAGLDESGAFAGLKTIAVET